MFEAGDRERLAKVSVYSLLDLALFVPSGYEDNSLSTQLSNGQEVVLELEVETVYKKGKLLRATAYEPRLEAAVELLYFNTLPYHKAMLKQGLKAYFKGKLDTKGKTTLLQPKIITEIGGIDFRYQTKALRKKTIRSLLEKYLSKAALMHEGLDDSIVDRLLEIHFPSKDNLLKLKNLDGDYLKVLKYTEIFSYLKKLSKKRHFYPATQHFQKDLSPFLTSLPFGLTGDQMKTVEAIAQDLAKSKAARRIVVGDVGSGKSIVMFAAAFLAHPSRSLIMAPTTVLANQLYTEAKKFLGDFLNVALFTQSQKDELRKADLIIGTHALLYTELPNIPLVMVDEQHRFGTAQRAQLAELLRDGEKRAHYIQFSATPIPRTKAMINASLVDFSFIKEIPFKKEVDTVIIKSGDFSKLLEHIDAEVKKGQQVAIVYPLVEQSENINYASIDEGREFWEKRFDKVFVTHGKDKEKERVLERFAEEGKILLSTTVIEVGISLPRLTTIVIVGAERLGFSQLHQLRGRVGRVGLKSCCYLFTKSKQNERLELFSKTNSGFDIAELDLEFRQSGDLLMGKKQSGKKFRFFDESRDFELLKAAKSAIDRN